MAKKVSDLLIKNLRQVLEEMPTFKKDVKFITICTGIYFKRNQQCRMAHFNRILFYFFCIALHVGSIKNHLLYARF